MFFNKKRYSFKPSYEAKTVSKLEELTNEYEKIFIKYISKKKLNTTEEISLSKGIKEVSFYIKTGILYQFLEDYNSKTSLSKKVETLFYKLKHQFEYPSVFKDFIDEEILILAEDVVFESLGMDGGDSFFVKTGKSSNFILFCKNKLFYKLLNFLETRVSFEKTFLFEDSECEIEKEEYIDKLIVLSKLDKMLNEALVFRIKECLMNNKIDEDLIEYIEHMVEYKEYYKC